MKERDFEHRTVHCGEVNLHVAEAKPEGGVKDDTPLVVFLHGFPEFWWSWRRQLEGLSDAGFWAVAPDMRGYGDSDKPWEVGAYEIEKLCGDIAALIRALGRKKAFVVGHDWGGVVAWAFAMEHPDLVEKLAILNAPHPLGMMRALRTPKQLKKSWYMFFFQLPKIPEWVMAKNDYAFLRKTFEIDHVPHDEVERYAAAMRVPGVPRSAINYYRAAIRRVLTGRAPKSKVIDAPTMVVWGDRDRYLGVELAEPPKRFVPNQRVEHIPGSSHWVQNDAPDRVNELLRDFFRV